MEAKFKRGDKVHMYPDLVTIYVVQEVKEVSVTFFYDLKNEKDNTIIRDVAEMKVQAI